MGSLPAEVGYFHVGRSSTDHQGPMPMGIDRVQDTKEKGTKGKNDHLKGKGKDTKGKGKKGKGDQKGKEGDYKGKGKGKDRMEKVWQRVTQPEHLAKH